MAYAKTLLAPDPRESRNGTIRWLYRGYFVLLLVAAAWLVAYRYYDPDEFEHLQFAWLIHLGEVPYRDFFEHHSPLFHWVLAALLGRFDVTRPDNAEIILATSRLLGFAFGIGVCGVTYVLARRLYDPRAATTAVALLVANSFFMDKAIEIRPDQLGALGLIACAYALMRALEPPVVGGTWMVLAGFFAMLAVFATQKTLFAMPGFAAAYVLLGWRRAGATAGIACGGAGVLLGLLPVIGYFGRHDALQPFVDDNYVLNAGWVRYYHGALFRWIKLSVIYDALFWLPAIIGLLRSSWRELPIVAPFVALALGAFIMPIAERQYIFLMLPFAAILAAAAIQRLGISQLIVLAACMVLAIGHFVLAATTFQGQNAAVRRELAYVLSLPPDATIMAGFDYGLALRRSAWRFPFVHPQLLPILERQHWAGLLEGLRNGSIRPDVLDEGLTTMLPPEFKSFVAEHYQPVGVASLWRWAK